MKKVVLFILLLSLVIFTACLDDTNVNEQELSSVRVDFASCVSCGECVNNFNCPVGAITYVRGRKAEIDTEKCIKCELCITDFNCPVNAFTTLADEVKPSIVKNFKVDSKTSSMINLSWNETGDNGDYSYPNEAYKYEIAIAEYEVTNENFGAVINKNIVYFDDESGFVTNFVNLDANKIFYIAIVAYDKFGNISKIKTLKETTN